MFTPVPERTDLTVLCQNSSQCDALRGAELPTRSHHYAPFFPGPGKNMTRDTSILKAVGNTPVVRLNNVVPRGSAGVFVKLEYYPTSSYKDRMALAAIEEAEKRGDLRPGIAAVKYTGGSTGSSLAFCMR